MREDDNDNKDSDVELRSLAEDLLPSTISEGRRDDLLYAFGAMVASEGVMGDALDDALAQVNTDRCDPPLPDPEVYAMARSVEDAFDPDSDEGSQSKGPFQVLNGRMHVVDDDGDSVQARELGNFWARVLRYELLDDGVDEQVEMVVHGEQEEGKDLPPVNVASDAFQNPTWLLEKWGHKHVIPTSERGLRSRIPEAIQVLSNNPPVQRVYAHTGWRRIEDDAYGYLHTEGAVTAQGQRDDVRVDLGGAMTSFRLPDPPEGGDLLAAVRHSLSLRSVAVDEVSLPLLSLVYTAPLNRVFSTDFVFWLVGPSGSYKSVLAGLAQGHFGQDFNARNLPAGFSGTANFLEHILFLAKDAIVTLDDWDPTPATKTNLQRKADRVVRAQGNHSGRGRMTKNIEMDKERPPRGAALVTGVGLPSTSGLQGRLYPVEVFSDKVNLDHMTDLQAKRDEGVFAQAMSGYLSWLAPRLDSKHDVIDAYWRRFRDHLRDTDGHARVPEATGKMLTGLATFLTFARDIGALSQSNAEDVWNATWRVCARQGVEQAHRHKEERTATQFLSYLSSAVSSGGAHIRHGISGGPPRPAEAWGYRKRSYTYQTQEALDQPDAEDTNWDAQGELIGWFQPKDSSTWEQPTVCLAPTAAMKVAMDHSRRAGSELPIGDPGIRDHLDEAGYIVKANKDRTTTRYRTPDGKNPRVLCVHADAIRDGPHAVDSSTVEPVSRFPRLPRVSELT